jgi:hypothetical protein
MGQASNAIKAVRLAAYSGAHIGTDYDYLVGTYQTKDAQAVRTFLDSLHIRHLFLEYTKPYLLDGSWMTWTTRKKPSGWRDVTLGPQQATFIIPGWPGDPAWRTGNQLQFRDLNEFNLEQAILRIAKSSLVDDFLFQIYGRGAVPAISAAYDIERGAVFNDVSNPSPKEALSYTEKVLEPFFKKFGGSINIIQTDPDIYRFKLAVQDLHDAVLKNVKDVERLHGSVEVSPQFNKPTINIQIIFGGEYAPMPFNQPPPDARYVDLQNDDLGKFADVLSVYLQSKQRGRSQ